MIRFISPDIARHIGVQHLTPTWCLPCQEAHNGRIDRYLCGFRTEGTGSAFPRREAHRGRIDGYLLGVRTEGTGTAFYFDEKHPLNVFYVICVACPRKGHSMVCDLNKKHTMYVLIIVCVGSVRTAHILRFTSARSTP